MAVFKIESGIPGEAASWELDLDTLMLDEGIELQRLTGLGPRQWIEALGEDDPTAVKFAFYLARKRAGETVAFKDVQVNLFGMSLTVIGEDDDEAEQPPVGVAEDLVGVVPTGLATSDEATTLI